jgi:subtilisin-like proprotein convertase family protein
MNTFIRKLLPVSGTKWPYRGASILHTTLVLVLLLASPAPAALQQPLDTELATDRATVDFGPIFSPAVAAAPLKSSAEATSQPATAPSLQTSTTPTRFAAPYHLHIGHYELPENAQTGSDLSATRLAAQTAKAPSSALSVPTPAPTLTASFQALDDIDISIPPDVHGAVGPNHVMTVHNTEVRIQTRGGTQLGRIGLNDWWRAFGGTFASTSSFDPKILYDPYYNRWIFTACANAGLTSSSLLLATSSSSDPTGTWFAVRASADASGEAWTDYPSIGFNKDWVVVSSNNYKITSGTSVGGKLFVFTKSQLYDRSLTSLRTVSLNVDTILVPAITYDKTAATLYFLQLWNGNTGGAGYLRLCSLTGPPGTETYNYNIAFPMSPSPWASTGQFSKGGNLPQLGSTARIDASDDCIQNVVYRNGSLWCTQTVFTPTSNPTNAQVQWWEVSVAGDVLQRARIGGGTSGFHCAYPNLAVNCRNDVLIGYSRFSAQQYASANFSYRLGTDAANTLRADTVLKAGEAPYAKDYGYGVNRWGDFSATMVDPVDDTAMWTIQEYAALPVAEADAPDADNNASLVKIDRWASWWGCLDFGSGGGIATSSFANTAGITVPDSGAAVPYASTIEVAGVTGPVSRVTVALTGLSHTSPADLRALLVSPGGQNSVLMSDAGGDEDLNAVILTFDDTGTPLASGTPIISGTYAPTNLGALSDSLPEPAPAGPYGTALSACNSMNPNGTWSLYVFDDALGGSGSLAGWSLSITTTTPLAVPEIAVEDPLGTSLTDGQASVDFGTVNVGLSSVAKTFTIRNTGSVALMGLNFKKDGANAAEFTLTQPNISTNSTLPPVASTTLAPGESTTFTITFRPGGAGVRSATLHLASSDADEMPFDIAITGTGRTPLRGKLAFGSDLFLVGEESGSLDVPLVRTGGSDGTVTVYVSSSNGTAIAPGDYEAINKVLVSFADGETARSVPLIVHTDALGEPSETLTLKLSGATGGAALGSPSTTTIRLIDYNDVVPPTVTITRPVANASLLENQASVSGTAADNNRVALVQVALNGGAFTNATTIVAANGLTATYTAPLAPLPGSNTVSVRSQDARLNFSSTLNRKFSYVVLRPLAATISPLGAGTLPLPFPTAAAMRKVNFAYKLTATPRAGFVFDGWTANDLTGTGITSAKAELASLNFTHQEGLAITANFIPNPFLPGIVGRYNGLVLPSAAVPLPNGTVPGLDTVGMLQNAVVSSTGAFTSRLRLDGRSLLLAGKFSNTGEARFGTSRTHVLSLPRPDKPSLDVALQLDMTGTTGKITGSVQQSQLGAIIARSTVDADRASYSTTLSVPAQLAGTSSKPYTLVFPSKPSQPTGLATNTYPQGTGYATLRVYASGTLTLSGKLADHTVITASAPLSKIDQWPVFAQLYALKGSLAGMATLADQDHVVGTELRWFRPAQAVQWYPTGWPSGILIDLVGAQYLAAATLPATSVFPGLPASSPNATLSFTSGQLSTVINQDIKISLTNLASNVPAATSPTLTLWKSSGLITGNFIHTDGSRPTYQGVILQNGTSPGGHGYFMTVKPALLDYLGESGSVEVLAK